MWVVGTIVGLAVELTVIVLLGRSATRRDDESVGDGPGRGAGMPLTGRARPFAVDPPGAVTGTPPVPRMPLRSADELATIALRRRQEWAARAAAPVPEPRRGD